MTFASEASKLLTNKYFLYFIAFLAISNVIGYLVTNKLKAVVFFVLVCILAYNFSKNMTVVLIIAIVTTNLMMVNKSMREGFREGAENMDTEGTEGTTTDTTTTDTTMTDTTMTDDGTMNADGTMTAKPPVKRAVKELQTTGKVSEPTKQVIKKNIMAKKPTATTTTTTDGTTETTETTEVETFAPAGSGFNGKKRGAIGGPAKAARIDYSTTLEQAYDNLDKMLGSDGLSNLSADTEKLMAQQERLFGSVQKFLPLIDKAQGMISSLDMDKINSLVGITEKFSSASGVTGGAGVKTEAFSGLTSKKK